MRQQISEVWKHIASRVQARCWLRTGYTRALETEIVQLRAENRALLNSILGLAGIPPMRAAAGTIAVSPAAADAFVAATLGSATAGRSGRGMPRPSNAPQKSGGVNPSLPSRNRTVRSSRAFLADDSRRAHSPGQSAPSRGVRRRSWQQIGRALEMEDACAAQRERESDTETFPAPRQLVPRV